LCDGSGRHPATQRPLALGCVINNQESSDFAARLKPRTTHLRANLIKIQFTDNCYLIKSLLCSRRSNSAEVRLERVRSRPIQCANDDYISTINTSAAGIKRIEYRTRATKVRGRILIYAAKGRYAQKQESSMLDEYKLDIDADDLPRGVIVGSVELIDADDGKWYLRNPERADRLLKPTGHPQPTFFHPWR
jgi:hypothetical protein